MPEGSHRTESRRRRREHAPLRKPIQAVEALGGGLICLLVIITPWLFGTTEDWAIRLMNTGAWITGILFAGAAILRRSASTTSAEEPPRQERIAAWTFLALNLAILGFCAVALWNARATFSIEYQSFTYFENFNLSLPTTYDAKLTRATLLMLSACFVIFWSTRRWILGGGFGAGILANRRFRILAWVISLNGFALAAQGILQRLSGSAKLLWIRDSYYNNPIACFGPFSYRGNAAEYLNLIWPVALGLWWILARERKRREGSTRRFADGPELLLLPASVVMIAACLISMSRGGAIIAIASLVAFGVVFVTQRQVSRMARWSFAGLVAVVFLMVGLLGWNQLTDRFKKSGVTDLSGREEIYANARQIAADFPLYGTGPGSFRSVYHLYRGNPRELWHGYLHDDWMEIRVTMGRVGLGLVIAQLLVLAAWIFMSGRPAVAHVFTASGTIALCGALIHAKFDFPFHTYSILFTFVVLAAILVSVTPQRK